MGLKHVLRVMGLKHVFVWVKNDLKGHVITLIWYYVRHKFGTRV